MSGIQHCRSWRSMLRPYRDKGGRVNGSAWRRGGPERTEAEL